MAFLTRVFSPQESRNQDMLGYVARMRVSGCEGILYSLSQKVHNFTRSIKVQELVAGTWFSLVLTLLAIRQLEELD